MIATLRQALKSPPRAALKVSGAGGGVRAFSRGGRGDSDHDGHKLTDLQLHEQYTGFMPRFQAARALLFTQEGEDKFEMYVDAKIGGGFLSKMRVLTDLEHPLFLKYNFDARDFMAGARGAFEGLTGDVLHSDEFKAYVSAQEGQFPPSVEEEIRDFIRTSEQQHMEQKDKEQQLQQSESPIGTPPGDRTEEKKSWGSARSVAETDSTVSTDSTETLDITDTAVTGSDNDNTEHEKIAFLASVCTEEGFQDFVNICRQEMSMTDNFVITKERLDSYFMSRAVIRVEEEEELAHVVVEGTGINEEDADTTVTTIDSNSSMRVIADITVKFITMCDIDLPMGEGQEAKKWKMMRVFNWTFSGQIDKCNRHNRGRGSREEDEELEWRISEVATTRWD